MTAPDAPANFSDPFFTLIDDGEWNACIGDQGYEENYVDGYMEAALELVSSVIDKRQYGKRDTLAMPILYNGRHAIELTLKYVIDRLCKAGVIQAPHPKNHDIKSHWTLLASTPLGDTRLSELVSQLLPFVDSLHGIDEDGQQLRYAETQGGQRSLEGKAICNLEVIRASLQALNQILMAMKYRVLELIDERATGTMTTKFSRRDLMQIVMMLPPRDRWTEPEFDTAKAAIMARFGIGSRQFSAAVDIIKNHREMGGLIGIEFNLAHLTDEHARQLIDEWSKVHPLHPAVEIICTDYFDRDWDKMRKDIERAQAANEAVLRLLSPAEIADLETVYYIGRERIFCEHYERQIQVTLEKYRLRTDNKPQVAHLMAKTNLLHEVAQGMDILGRRRLAAELRAKRPDLKFN